jgi:DNA-binding NarL/FixJ family response regulator
MKKISLFLIDDHTLFTQSFRSYIENDNTFSWAGSSNRFENGITQIESVKPDIILIDYHLKNENGIDILGRINQLSYKIIPIILTMNRDERLKDLAISKGARGYLLKDMDAKEIIDALLSIVEDGKTYIPNKSYFDQHYNRFNCIKELTTREYEIALLACRGLSSEEISQQLFLSVLTVKTHRKNILSKLCAKNTLEACRIIGYRN